MKPLSGPQLARALEKRGWTLLRIAGSHHVYGKAGLQRHLVKLVGLDDADLG